MSKREKSKREKPPRPTTDVVKLKILHMKRLATGNEFLVGSSRVWLNGCTMELSILRSKKPDAPTYWIAPPGRRTAGGAWIPMVWVDEIQLTAMSTAVLSVWARYQIMAIYHDLHRQFPDAATMQSLMEDAELDSDPDNLKIAVDALLTEFTS